MKKLHKMTQLFNYQMPESQVAAYWEVFSKNINLADFCKEADRLMLSWTFPGRFPLPGNFDALNKSDPLSEFTEAQKRIILKQPGQEAQQGYIVHFRKINEQIKQEELAKV